MDTDDGFIYEDVDIEDNDSQSSEVLNEKNDGKESAKFKKANKLKVSPHKNENQYIEETKTDV